MSDIKLKARHKMMDLIALRDHSEKELRQKLKQKLSYKNRFSRFKKPAPVRKNSDLDEERATERAAELDKATQEAIEAAIQFAKEQNWIGDPQKLAERMADILHRKNKGINYINNYLREKGLPAVAPDRDLELEKALDLVKNKYDEETNFDRAEKARVARFLASRGFDSDTVRKVIYEKL